MNYHFDTSEMLAMDGRVKPGKLGYLPAERAPHLTYRIRTTGLRLNYLIIRISVLMGSQAYSTDCQV